MLALELDTQAEAVVEYNQPAEGAVALDTLVAEVALGTQAEAEAAVGQELAPETDKQIH